jgi:thioredoxin 1
MSQTNIGALYFGGRDIIAHFVRGKDIYVDTCKAIIPKLCTTDVETDDLDELEEIRQKKLQQMMTDSGKVGIEWPSHPIEITDSDFDGFAKQYKLTVVDCWAPWCGPCRMIAPIVESLSKELQGKIAFGKLNTDENQLTAMRHNIAAIPTLLVFKDGKLVERIVGALPKEHLLKKLQKHL